MGVRDNTNYDMGAYNDTLQQIPVNLSIFFLFSVNWLEQHEL